MIGFGSELLLTWRERQRGMKATDENEQIWLLKQKATTGGRRKIRLEFRPTSLSLYRIPNQNIRIVGVEYTRRRKENTQGARETPLAQVGLNVQVTNRAHKIHREG